MSAETQSCPITVLGPGGGSGMGEKIDASVLVFFFLVSSSDVIFIQFFVYFIDHFFHVRISSRALS